MSISDIPDFLKQNFGIDKILMIYDSKYVGDKLKYIPSKYPNTTPQFYSYTKNKEDLEDKLKKIFKTSILQKTNFQSCSVFIEYDDVIAHDSLEFAAFVNGLDIKRDPYDFMKTYDQIEEGTEIKFLTEDLFIEIVNKFIGFLIEKEGEDDKYFSIGKKNKFCKISSSLNPEDYENITNIFNIKIDKAKDDFTPNRDYYIHFLRASKNVDGKLTKEFEIDLYNLKNLYKNDLNDIKGKEKLNDDSTAIIQNRGNVTKIFFANPLIKYIYLIINYLYTHIPNLPKPVDKSNFPEVSNVPSQIFYRAATFFIYKYINFIVNQGRSIVTNLEHLKFFFLTRTGAINEYNKDKDKSFECGKENACREIIDESKIYKKGTLVGKTGDKPGVIIDELINFGNMKAYGLIDILQKLSSSPSLDECKKTDGNLNLLEYQTKTDSNSKTALLGAIFIMFTNYKIFLDNEIDNQPIDDVKTKLDTLCKAAIDTANFTQSISSTSINKKPVLKSQEIQPGFSNIGDMFQDLNLLSNVQEFEPENIVGGKRKFNMGHLLEHKNKKPRTHRNLSFKNKKNKVFYNRTKKNT
jgi:hypothetical protein